MQKNRKIIISVINDLVTDQRVHKVCLSLLKIFPNVELTLVGRVLKTSLPVSDRLYDIHRMRLFFETGVLFYLEYNLRLFFFILFRKADLLVANDLDTLLPNYLNSKLKNKPLVYDSHEYFTEVPELQGRKLKQAIWKRLEQFIFPRLEHVITVNNSLSKIYEQEYSVKVNVVRNTPSALKSNKVIDELTLCSLLNIENEAKIVLYQGALNVDRGLNELIDSMLFVEKNVVLLLIGKGDIENELKAKVKEHELNSRVIFTGAVEFSQLHSYTKLASIGVSLEKETNWNYRLALPNKLFDYIHARVPVLASPLIEVSTVFNQFNIGERIESHDPKHIAFKINEMLFNVEKRIVWKENLNEAAQFYCWEKEELMLKEIYSKLI